MNNLRGRLGSTRQVRGLGCDTDSSTIWCELHSGLHLAAVIEGGQRSCNSEAYATPSDLSRSSISERFDARLHGAGINDEENAGRYSKRMSGMDWEFSVAATSWSGDSMAYGQCQPLEMIPHCYRNHGNPYIEEKARLRSQQLLLEAGGYRHEKCGASLVLGG
jgi:hypothetical protein